MKEYIIKIDEDKKDIMGNCPLVEQPQELIRCKDCKHGERVDKTVYCDGYGIHRPDWFCADGVKRE